MKETELRSFFKPGEFKNSCTLEVTGALEFAQGSLDKADKKDDKKTEEVKKVETKAKDDKQVEKKEDTKEADKTKEKDGCEKEKPKPATLRIEGYLSRSKSSVLD